MRTLSTTGIILRRIEYSEADRIITFLTPDHGKVLLLAKGVRKAKSKLAGGIELFSDSELHFIRGRGDIGTLVSTRLKTHYGSIVKDLKRTELAYFMLQTIDKLVEDATGQEYYPVLLDSLAALDDADMPLSLSEASFRMRVLQLMGQAPDVTRNADGGKLSDAPGYSFDFEAVAFRPEPEGVLTQNHLKLIKLLAVNSPRQLRAIERVGQYSEDVLPLIRSLMQFYTNSA